ncbi:phage head closure protein [Romboutsia lituseburensis]|uniref:phage head closure protein n=1 Tax=Romboutsia lituseburensis TaxID=1537 RepID=UPI0022EAD398|nr:phage head closure protein [Romboutsia lituseburensis]
MNAGELREIIEIQEYKEILVDGFTSKEYVTIHKLRAKKKTVSTKEYLTSNANTTKLTLKFIVRKRDINSDNYVLYKNERYDIKHIHEFEDRAFIELTVEKVN